MLEITLNTPQTVEVATTGPRGPQGVAGQDGDPGPAGPAGADGADGAAGPSYAATSATSLSIGSGGSITFTTQAGLAYSVGARVRLYSTGTGAWMEGTVTAYSGTSMTILRDLSSGSGTATDWTINIAGAPARLPVGLNSYTNPTTGSFFLKRSSNGQYNELVIEEGPVVDGAPVLYLVLNQTSVVDPSV